MKNFSQAVNVIVKMLLDCYSLIIEINLSLDNDRIRKENLPKIKLIRADLDKCISILSEHAAEKGTLHCLPEIYNILNILDQCIWSLARQKMADTTPEEIRKLRDEINILIKIYLDDTAPYIIKH